MENANRKNVKREGIVHNNVYLEKAKWQQLFGHSVLTAQAPF